MVLVVIINVCVNGATAKGDEVVGFAVAIKIGVADRSLGCDARGDYTYIVLLAPLAIRDIAIIAEASRSAALILDDIVGLTISHKVSKPDLTARLADSGSHDDRVLPDMPAILRWDVLIILPVLNRSAIVKDKEVIIAVSVEICKPNLAARLSNAWRDDDTVLLDTLAAWVREVAII
ncbi:hypothetical protein ACJZ2D_003036 [Fusarium nematophilum]